MTDRGPGPSVVWLVRRIWAAYLHGRAGERPASSVGPQGFLARELPGEVPAAPAEAVP
ncbi:hypothetical protein [Blastococcus colisei]|uniref:hypothetical protein n=1 Tax=Blastococcus colisei TaxID=1564162 RepID=UPI00147735DE|nr:hypothetical protein [Blastococcus colisei]